MQHAYNGIELTPEQIANHNIRHETVLAILKSHGAKTIIDVGCSYGTFLDMLIRDGSFTHVIGIDPAIEKLMKTNAHLKSIATNKDVTLMSESIFSASKSQKNIDAVTLIEVIEHFPESQLQQLAESLLKDIRPRIVVITTPLAVPSKTKEKMAIFGHFFEWNQKEFKKWTDMCDNIYGYTTRLSILSGPTFKRGCQVAVLLRNEKDLMRQLMPDHPLLQEAFLERMVMEIGE